MPPPHDPQVLPADAKPAERVPNPDGDAEDATRQGDAASSLDLGAHEGRVAPLRPEGRPRRFFLLGRDPSETAGPLVPIAQPDWLQANPSEIQRALAASQRKPTGGWIVVDGSARITQTPSRYTLAGREWVAWRCASGVRLAPEACPHMGARLSDGHVDGEGRIVCPWHGLALGSEAHGGWKPARTFDDGVLVWARFDRLVGPSESLTEKPYLPVRPAHLLSGTIRMEARCSTADVLQNRLDPWHGAHFHPHSFGRLAILSRSDDAITVRVVYRIAGPIGMEVDARFDCPDARTIVMTIVAGDGVGSIVETHASPIDDERTAIVEATLATSDRPTARLIMQLLGRAIRPMVETRAKRLWVEDAAYCERLAELRRR